MVLPLCWIATYETIRIICNVIFQHQIYNDFLCIGEHVLLQRIKHIMLQTELLHLILIFLICNVNCFQDAHIFFTSDVSGSSYRLVKESMWPKKNLCSLNIICTDCKRKALKMNGFKYFPDFPDKDHWHICQSIYVQWAMC